MVRRDGCKARPLKYIRIDGGKSNKAQLSQPHDPYYAVASDMQKAVSVTASHPVRQHTAHQPVLLHKTINAGYHSSALPKDNKSSTHSYPVLKNQSRSPIKSTSSPRPAHVIRKSHDRQKKTIKHRASTQPQTPQHSPSSDPARRPRPKSARRKRLRARQTATPAPPAWPPTRAA